MGNNQSDTKNKPKWKCTKCGEKYFDNPKNRSCRYVQKIVNKTRLLECYETFYSREHIGLEYDKVKIARCRCQKCLETFTPTSSKWLSVQECILQNDEVYNKKPCDSRKFTKIHYAKNNFHDSSIGGGHVISVAGIMMGFR